MSRQRGDGGVPEPDDPLLPWLRHCLDLHDRIGASLPLPGLLNPSD